MRLGLLQLGGAAALALMSTAAAAQEAASERRYYVSEERSYGTNGSAGAQAVVSRRTSVGTDGSRTHAFYVSGAFAYDTIIGTLSVRSSPQPVATLTTSPDRRALMSGGSLVRTVTEPAALGAVRARENFCSARTEQIDLPLLEAVAGARRISLAISIRPVEQVCQISWSTRDAVIESAGGAMRGVEFRGVALSDRAAELIASHAGFNGESGAGAPIRGHRGVFLVDAGGDWNRYAGLIDLPGLDVRRPDEARPTPTSENAAAALDSARAASMTSLIETAVLAYAEGHVNPLPVIIGTFYVLDNVSAVLVNAAGAGVLAVNSLTGAQNATAQGIGNAMLGYSGIIGETIEAGVGALWGQTAGEVAGLAYATATVFTPSGAVNRAFTTAALEHMLTRGVTGGGQLGNILIDLGVQSQTVRPWLSQTQLGAQYLDQIVDWIQGGQSNANNTALDLAGQQAGSRVSPTPTARDAMADLEFADFLRQITDPRSPFNQSTSGDFLESAGGLSDVIIAGALSFRLFDHAVQDGDIVSLNVTGNGQTVLAATVTLTNAGQIFNPGVGSGQAVITVTALNLGDLVPNTGAVTVTSPIVSGNGTQIYNLQVGGRGVLRVLVLGRRARGM